MLGGGLGRMVAALVAVMLVAAACGGGAGGGGPAGREPAAGVPVEAPEPSSGEELPSAPEPGLPPAGMAEGGGEAVESAAPDERRPSVASAAAGVPAGPPPQPPSIPPEPAAPPESPEPAAPPEPAEPLTPESPEPVAPPEPPEPLPSELPEPAAPPEPPEPAPPHEPARDDEVQDAAPAPVGERPDVPVMLQFAECERDYLCGTVTVPLDHDDPRGAAVELAVGMVPARDPALRIGYLLVNPGGPGGGMDGFLDFGAGLSNELLGRFDVVGWDPRGVGGSVPSGCRDEARHFHLVDPAPDSAAEQAELDAAARTLAEACVANLGAAVGHIGTMDTVRDMDAIRRALGTETISFLGFSYGTRLGLLYADMFGERLRAAVLDGVVDPSLGGAELAVGQMVGFTRAIEAMFAWCRSDRSCAVTDDPEETYDRLLVRIDAEPMRDSAERVVLGPARAILAAVMASYSSELWPEFFDGLAAAVNGDGTLLGLLGEFYTDLGDLGAFVSVVCTDGGAADRAELDAFTEALVAVAGDFGRASAVSGLPCEHWPVVAGTLPVGPIAAPDAPPILVVGNRGDNATPYEWAASVSRQLASGVLVSYDGNDHTSYGLSRCVTAVADEYLVDLVVPSGDVDCPAEG